MSKTIHDLEQGSAAWHAFRAEHFGASEAAAMLGLSKHQTRAELLRRKATGIEPDVSPRLQAIFDRGHQTEIGGRAMAQSIIGQELYPVTVSEGRLSASCDGLTMLEDIAFEHKQYNAALADAVRAGMLPTEHQPQCQQVLMLTGADKLLFMVSDGTSENCAWMWVVPDDRWRTEIVHGWTQFAIDLEAYVHAEAKPEPTAATIEALPALFVQVEGKVLATNLDAFKAAAQTFIDGIKTELVNDQDFADADKMVKFLKDGEERLALAKSQALAQTASIDELFRTVDAISEQMKAKRLALDKLVKSEKENRKHAILAEANAALWSHLDRLNERIGGNWIPRANAPFVDAIKGLKSLDSMRDKVAGALANAKIEANEIADRIEKNAKSLVADGNDWRHLFPDFAQVCTKAREDFAALHAMRIQQEAVRKEAEREKIRQEAVRKEAEREKIRQEEVERIQRENAQAPRDKGEAVSNDQRGKADVGSAMPACERTTAAPDAGFVPVEMPAGNAASAASTPPIRPDEALIDDFLKCRAISPADKKALRVHLVAWETYRVKREMAVAA